MGARRRRAYETLARLAIDTVFETSAVYALARQVGFAKVAPVKGVEGFNRSSPVSGPTFVDATEGGKRLRRDARLWTVAVSTFKAETDRFLRLDRPRRNAPRARPFRPERSTCRHGSRANG
jgi:phage terminase large subunit GpA-like protein